MPTSVHASEEFTVKGDLSTCFSFFTNLSNIGSCIPGCEQVIPKDSESAIFKIKLKIGYISRTFELRAKLKDIKENKHISFTGEGSDAEVQGELSLRKIAEKEVAISYRIEIAPISVLGKSAVSMIGKDLVRKQASEFSECVKAKLANAPDSS